MIQLHAIRAGRVERMATQKLSREDDLQRWIAADPGLIGLDVLVIGREIAAYDNGRIDVLALDGDGNLVVIECKRDRTPREVIAQLLDYASWASEQTTRQIHDLAAKTLKRPLFDAFSEAFGTPIPEALNSSQSLIVVATEFDSASRRIVQYLAEKHSLAINAIFFSVFEHQGEQLLALEWLLDQETVVQRAEEKVSAPWTGLYYANVGESKDRAWEDMRKFGFLSAGGGGKYIRALSTLKPGNFVMAYQKQAGYVGLGEVVGSALPVSEFRFGDQPILSLPLQASDFGHNLDDLELCEFVVGVDWKKTFPLSEAKTFQGVFANQNVVCKLRDPATLRFLAQSFPLPASVVSTE